MNRREEIKERLSKRTPGKWIRYSWDHDTSHGVRSEDDSVIANYQAAYPEGPISLYKEDAEFIAHAPGDVEYLLAKLETAEAILMGIAGEEMPLGAKLIVSPKEAAKEALKAIRE